MDQARAEAQRVRALEATAAAQKQQIEQLESRGLNEQQVDSYLTTACADRLLEFSIEQGLLETNAKWADLNRFGILPKERVASKGDDFGVLRFEREGRAAIKKAVDAKLHDEIPPTNVPASRGTGDNQQDKSSYSLFKSHFEKQRATREVPR